MANAKPSSDPNPAATATATSSDHQHPPWISAVVPVGLAILRGGDRAEVAFIAFLCLNLQLFFWSGRRYQSSLPGSVAGGRARVAMWVLSSTFHAAFTWKMAAVAQLSFAIVAGVTAAATVGFAFACSYI